MHKTLEKTRFAGCDIVSVAANPGGSESTTKDESNPALNIDLLINVFYINSLKLTWYVVFLQIQIRFKLQTIKKHTYIPSRSSSGPFIFTVDHCFSIRGQGTVMTGTVLNGQVSINDNVEISSLQV